VTIPERVVTPGARLRNLITAEVSDNEQPADEWAYRHSLRPSRVLGDLWRARQIVRTITERNLRVRYKQSVLGFAWALLTPVGLLVVLTFVFGRVAGVDTGGIPYPLFAYIGLLPWAFFASAIATGGSSIVSDKALLNKSQFPREVFPLSAVAVAGVDAGMALVPLVVLFLVEQQAPAATTALAIVPLLVLIVFTTGMALALASIIVYLRDVRVVLPLLLQIGLFATPVAYGLELIPGWARLAYCFLNPVAPVIDSFRRTVLLGQAPQWDYLGAGAVTATVVLVVGYALFKRLEGGMADVA